MTNVILIYFMLYVMSYAMNSHYYCLYHYVIYYIWELNLTYYVLYVAHGTTNFISFLHMY